MKERFLVAAIIFMGSLIVWTKTSIGKFLDDSNWVGKPAPELIPGDWINSKPIKLSELRGSVVLIEFWTFDCYNCRNTILYLKVLKHKFSGEKFRIIGIHTPEFDHEKVFSNVIEKVKYLGIEYPILTDNDYRNWYAYQQRYWPSIYLVDKNGMIQYVHIGEGGYDETEQNIKSLLAKDR